MKSYILLENVKLYAFHGVFNQETRVGNNFLLNIKLEVNIKDAIDSDNVEDTINYAEVYSIIQEEMAIPSKLIEHVGGRIISRLRKNYKEIETIELKLSKLNPPVCGEVEAASIIIID